MDDNTAMGVAGVPKEIQSKIGEFPRAEEAELKTHQNMDCNAMPIGLHDNIGRMESYSCSPTVLPI